MSSKKKKENAPGMPSGSAGLMRFFQDESNGPKIPPEYVVILAVILIASVIGGRFFFPNAI
jgi:preprotein translocase subunit Sec61beta